MTRKITATLAALAALSTLTACEFFGGPELDRPDFDEPELIPEQQSNDGEPELRVNEAAFRTASMAVLGVDDEWNVVITLLDVGGNERGSIETGIETWGGANFAVAESGFVVQSDSSVYAVSWDGVVSLITTVDASYVWRIDSGPDGSIAISEEDEMEEVDEDGDVIMTVADYDSCFMDVDFSADGTSISAVNTYGPDVVSWDSQTGAVTSQFTYSPQEWGADMLGRDGDGMVWVGEASGARLHVQSVDNPSTSVALGSLTQLGVPAWSLWAVERATNNSVYVLYEGNAGTGIVEVDRDGNVDEVVTSNNAWMDLVRL